MHMVPAAGVVVNYLPHSTDCACCCTACPAAEQPKHPTTSPQPHSPHPVLFPASRFSGVIHGFELNPTSATLARENAERAGLADIYQVSRRGAVPRNCRTSACMYGRHRLAVQCIFYLRGFVPRCAKSRTCWKLSALPACSHFFVPHTTDPHRLLLRRHLHPRLPRPRRHVPGVQPALPARTRLRHPHARAVRRQGRSGAHAGEVGACVLSVLAVLLRLAPYCCRKHGTWGYMLSPVCQQLDAGLACMLPARSHNCMPVNVHVSMTLVHADALASTTQLAASWPCSYHACHHNTLPCSPHACTPWIYSAHVVHLLRLLSPSPSQDLLSQGFPYAVLLVSSYSHPASVLAHAAACGYRVVDFLVTPLPFGTYSSQPKVRDWGLEDV